MLSDLLKQRIIQCLEAQREWKAKQQEFERLREEVNRLWAACEESERQLETARCAEGLKGKSYVTFSGRCFAVCPHFEDKASVVEFELKS